MDTRCTHKIMPGDHVMKLGEWITAVHQGSFIDYDGFGYYSDGICTNEDHMVKPSQVYANTLDTSYTHIVWLNR